MCRFFARKMAYLQSKLWDGRKVFAENRVLSRLKLLSVWRKVNLQEKVWVSILFDRPFLNQPKHSSRTEDYRCKTTWWWLRYVWKQCTSASERAYHRWSTRSIVCDSISMPASGQTKLIAERQCATKHILGRHQVLKGWDRYKMNTSGPKIVWRHDG